jgi:hypothetical protein
VQPVGGSLGEAQQERPAARRRHALELGFAHDFRPVGIGDDEARLERHQAGGRPLSGQSGEGVRDKRLKC